MDNKKTLIKLIWYYRVFQSFALDPKLKDEWGLILGPGGWAWVCGKKLQKRERETAFFPEGIHVDGDWGALIFNYI